MDQNELLQIIERAAKDNSTDLDLANKNLTMLLPQIGQLTNLRELHLSRNQLTVLPAEIGQLFNLRELGLGSNQLTTLPPELGHLQQLEELYLDHNQLTDFPSVVLHLPSLMRLDIASNGLTTLPAEIRHLSNLKMLGLRENKLMELPMEIGELVNLTDLYLDRNQLTMLTSEIRQLTQLQWFYISHNQLILANLGALFPGTQIVDVYPFRVTRDAEMEIQELESDDLLETIEEAVWMRRFRHVVRLEITRELPPGVLTILATELDTSPNQVYRVRGPLGLNRLFQLPDLDLPRLKYKRFVPSSPADLRPNAKEDIFALIRREDVLLHHPFESFQPVSDFLRAAAVDPQVLAIKMTLYRVGRNSPIVESLQTAVQEGKQVSVLVELKARFDEESNIEWTRALERDGIHVVYGLVGLKVHSKIALVVRREGAVLQKYVHLGTGNYNPVTARLYTDCGPRHGRP